MSAPISEQQPEIKRPSDNGTDCLRMSTGAFDKVTSATKPNQEGYAFYMWGSSSPVYIKNLSENHCIQHVSCGVGNSENEMAYVVNTNGELREWNSSSEKYEKKSWFTVGHNDRIVSREVLLENVSSIVSGKSYHVAVDTDGKLFFWGIEVEAPPEGASYQYAWSYSRKPDLVKGLSSVQIKQVGVGWAEHRDENLTGYCITALTAEGQVYSWGKNQFGMTGLGTDSGQQEEPACVPGFEEKQVVQIATFQHHSAAITSDGSLYTWGRGLLGRLGHGNETDCLIPTNVEAMEAEILQGNKFIQVACGGEHTVALTSSGKVFAFGNNALGQVGQGGSSQTRYLTPILVEGLAEHTINKVACGYDCSFAISHEGELFRWGCERKTTYRPNIQWQPVAETCFRDQRVEGIQCFGDTFAASLTPSSDYVPLTKGFYSCVNDDEFSDVTFVVGGESVRAHRIILARRSKFFYKMFTSGMRESLEETIPLSGVSKDVFLVLLHYLYTDEIEVEVSNVLELFQAADMFVLPKLQDTCVEAAKKKMSIPEAAIFLQQAHDRDYTELKDVAMSFVRNKFDEVSQTQGMKEVTADLMLEIVRGFILARHSGRCLVKANGSI